MVSSDFFLVNIIITFIFVSFIPIVLFLSTACKKKHTLGRGYCFAKYKSINQVFYSIVFVRNPLNTILL